MTLTETHVLLLAEVLAYALACSTTLLAKRPVPVWYLPALIAALVLPSEHGWAIALIVAIFGLALWQGPRLPFTRNRDAEWIIGSTLVLVGSLLWLIVGQDLDVRDTLPTAPMPAGRLACVYLTIAILIIGTIHSGRIIGDVLEREGIQPKATDDDQEEQGVEHGWLIGYLERVLAIILVAYGSVEGLGFLAAAKGLVRAQEWKDRALAEYFLVGTLLSILMATGLGLLLKAAYSQMW